MDYNKQENIHHADHRSVVSWVHGWQTPTMWTGLACVLAAMVMLPGPFGIAHLLAITGSLLLVGVNSSAYIQGARTKDTSKETPENNRLTALGDLLDRRLEQLQDQKWELSESTVRYRELLDAQNGLIVRRNASGELTFVNLAFCNAFGMGKSELLGSRFQPTFLDDDGEQRSGSLPTATDTAQAQHVLTTNGPRWIQWETHELPSDETSEAVIEAQAETQLVGHDITRQKVDAANLRDARDLAQAGNRAKSRFLAAMSHEIRTPMNGIVGMTSLLRETSQTPEQQSYCHAIEQSARALSNLIDEILDFSKIEAGKVTLHDAPFNLEACIQSAVELLAPRAFEKGLQIAWNIDTACPDTLSGDETRVHQILLNLLSNAIKFTDRGGVTITVKVDAAPIGDAMADGKDGAAVRIDICDTGIGLSKADNPELFHEFEQSNAAIARHSGGTGLGLAISRRLAIAMGGDVIMESKLGAGSTFSLVLPARDLNEQSVGQPARQPHIVGGSANVLIVSTRQLERRVMGEVLRDHSFNAIETAPSTAMAQIQKAQQRAMPFDRIVIDASVDHDLARALLERSREINSQTLGLVAVEAIERRHLEKYLAAGYATHLIRPIRPKVLVSEVTTPHETRAHVPSDQPTTQATSNHYPKSPDTNPVSLLHTREPVQTLLQSPSSGRLILLAEDNAINELLATRIIEKAGNSSVSVRTGVEAVSYMRAALNREKPMPELILMDIMMPEMDGVTATEQIKALYVRHDSATSRCPPIIALTANAFDEDRQNYLAQGLDDYLSKPFEAHELASLIDRWCTRSAHDTRPPPRAKSAPYSA